MKESDDKRKLYRNAGTVTEVILDRLYSWGVTTLFCVPGAHIQGFLMDAIKDNRFCIVMAAHEQGAGYMADGYARVTRGPGFAMTINGPGANNLTTAAVTAKMDHSPILFLTGDSPWIVKGFGSFQCSDSQGSNSTGIFREAIENSASITTGKTLLDALDRFEELLESPCPGPMHINLPNDIAKEHVGGPTFPRPKKDTSLRERPHWLGKIPLTPGNKGAILVGEEVKSPSEMQVIAEFGKTFAIPVASTLETKGIQAFIPKELNLGVFGYAGGPRAFQAILHPQLETLIILGAILDERNTAAWNGDFFHPNRKILRFSSDKETLRKYPKPILVEAFDHPLRALYWLKSHWLEELDCYGQENENQKAWNRELQAIPVIPPANTGGKLKDKSAMLMTEVVSIMNKNLPLETKLFLDSGDHRIYGGTYWQVGAGDTFFTAAQTAPMGWAIGAAVGASFAKEKEQIWVLAGDGCMLMHGMEISVAAKYKCPVVFVVSNNGSYGRIAARMLNEPEMLRDTISSLPVVSWTNFANSMGVPARKVSTGGELTAAIREAKDCSGPFLTEIMTIYEEEYPYPPAVFSSSSQEFAKDWKKRKLKI